MKYGLFASWLVGILALMAPQIAQVQDLAQDWTPRCDGADLRSTLAPSDIEQINKVAASLPNSKGLFWKIEKSGTSPSWLLGTIHVSDDRVVNRLTLPAERAALDSADRLALELYFDDYNFDDNTRAAETLLEKIFQQYPEIFTYSEENVVKNSIPAPQFALFEQALKKRGLSYAPLSRTKPWLIWATLSRAPCIVARGDIGIAGLDARIGSAAQARGMPIIGLEDIEEQLRAIDSLPLNFTVTAIIQLGFLTDRLNDYHETMVSLYLDEEVGAIMPTMQALIARDLEAAGLGDAEGPSVADMLSFETILLDERNAIMAARAAPLLEEGNSFIAVGALHLVGTTGLVEQFRRQGYQVTLVERTNDQDD